MLSSVFLKESIVDLLKCSTAFLLSKSLKRVAEKRSKSLQFKHNSNHLLHILHSFQYMCQSHSQKGAKDGGRYLMFIKICFFPYCLLSPVHTVTAAFCPGW